MEADWRKQGQSTIHRSIVRGTKTKVGDVTGTRGKEALGRKVDEKHLKIFGSLREGMGKETYCP